MFHQRPAHDLNRTLLLGVGRKNAARRGIALPSELSRTPTARQNRLFDCHHTIVDLHARECIFRKIKRQKTSHKIKRQIAKGKSLFGSKALLFFRLRKAILATEGIRKKESADLLPFEICLLPFDFKRSL
jgi:hypothetical protein